MVRMSQRSDERSPKGGRCRGRAFAVALTMLVEVAATPAAPQTASLTLRELNAAIGEWVASEMHVAAPARLPRLEFATAERLRRLRYGDQAATVATLNVVALYDDETGTILLPLGWTGTSPAEMSVLVHEMVHHLQTTDGRDYACGRAREADAYEVQGRWLALYGETLETSFQLNPLALLILTHCGI